MSGGPTNQPLTSRKTRIFGVRSMGQVLQKGHEPTMRPSSECSEHEKEND
jgi:hypothetical protein